MNRLETAKKKREIAIGMLRNGKTNEEIKQVIVSKFGVGISTSDLSELRSQLGRAGKNSRRRVTDLVPMAKAEVLWVPNNDTSLKLHGKVKELLAVMHEENVTSMHVSADGLVKLEMTKEFIVQGDA